MKIEVICPLYKGEKYILDLVDSINNQVDVENVKINFILTDTGDKSEEILKNNNLEYEKILPKDFSHSLTREKAALNSDSDIVVFITQDIEIVDDKWLYNLTKDIKGDVVAAYSRQVTKYDNIEKYTREKNYPETSKIVSKDDIKELGLKTFFFSDASSAISTKIFKELNGYDGKNLPISEDMYIAYKIIMNDYKIKYAADSVVFHSHNFKLKELYDRYKLTGKFFKQNSYLDQYGTTSSGASLAKYVLKRIFQEKRFLLLFRYPFDMAARLIGMKVGKR